MGSHWLFVSASWRLQRPEPGTICCPIVSLLSSFYLVGVKFDVVHIGLREEIALDVSSFVLGVVKRIHLGICVLGNCCAGSDSSHMSSVRCVAVLPFHRFDHGIVEVYYQIIINCVLVWAL